VWVSVLRFSLPSHTHNHQNLARYEQEGKSSMRKRILVADDDPGIGDMLREMLTDAGYTVEVQVDGRVVQQMREPLPDLLLLDIRLSGMDGQMICGQLKSQQATRHLPIILLSAHKNTQRIARDAGADDFLAKPFEMKDLQALIAQYVGNA
jgi:CheY-like chemotaxis protein